MIPVVRHFDLGESWIKLERKEMCRIDDLAAAGIMLLNNQHDFFKHLQSQNSTKTTPGTVTKRFVHKRLKLKQKEKHTVKRRMLKTQAYR